MTSNIIVKVNRRLLDSIRSGVETSVHLPANPHWNRKLRNPGTGRYYNGLRVIVRSYEKEPSYVVSAKSGTITFDGSHYTVSLRDITTLLPPFSHQLINETRRNSIR